ncbi:hypothetical protein DAPPUDRAFT_247913 [Daphnia pulex]|uniref:small monomeric GTPase n=1 Tax=Daphnia pulex TaxID=6669 RepID=E9GT44_DAPPU|nr:hypothetical protein DAPPUDRAFT_247913 [Daphnia pulex]|eukprot:EFX77336.1 hypothetical protein DAPPUDRAFT_247913 [Daphnia pulex]
MAAIRYRRVTAELVAAAAAASNLATSHEAEATYIEEHLPSPTLDPYSPQTDGCGWGREGQLHLVLWQQLPQNKTEFENWLNSQESSSQFLITWELELKAQLEEFKIHHIENNTPSIPEVYHDITASNVVDYPLPLEAPERGERTLLFLCGRKSRLVVRIICFHIHNVCLGLVCWSPWDVRINLVDAFDAQCFAESKNELFSLLADEQLGHCPILVLGNKIDRPGAASEEKLRVYFELHNTTGKGKTPRSQLSSRPLELFVCSVLKRQGYGEVFCY